MRLEGSRALLTGASGGIGKAIARALHVRGAEVLVTARREEVLNELRDELGDRVTPLPADLADRESAAELAGRAGAVDVLVANAALPGTGPIVDFTPEEIDRALDVNLRAPMQLTRALLPGMVERGRGHLVFISSLSGKATSPGSGIYSATKYGMRGFAGGVREDLHDTDVGVSVVFPGFIREAGMFADSGAELPKGVGTSTPDEVAAGVVRAIERNKAELDVAPLALRLGTKFSELSPQLASRVQRRLGSSDVARSMAAGQRDKR